MISDKEDAVKRHNSGGTPPWFPWVAVFMFMLIINAAEAGIISIGVVIPSLVAEFSTSLFLVSLAATMHYVTLGLAAPFVGRLLDTYSIHAIMIAGSVLLLIGCLVASQAESVYIFLLAYGLLGLGSAFLHPMVAIKYLSYFFERRMGLATGVAVIPFGLVAFPPVAHLLVEEWGWRFLYVAIGILVAGVFILVLMLKRPDSQAEKSSTTTPDDDSVSQHHSGQPVAAITLYKILLTSPVLWVLVGSTAIFMSIGGTLLTHMVVYGAEKGLTATQSVSLISFWGLAVLAGMPLAGWFMDKYSPRAGFAAMGILSASAVSGLVVVSSYPILVVIMLSIGVFSGGAFVCFTGMLRVLVGNLNFGTAIGALLLVKLPMVAFAPPLAGLVYDLYGSYSGYMTGLILSLVCVSLIFLLWVKSIPLDLHSKEIEGDLVPAR